MDRSLPARPRQSRRQQQGGRLASVIDDYDDVAGDDIMDDDILAKLAARSHGPPPGRRANRPSATRNADDDMPDLTGMTSSVNSSTTTTSQPGERPRSTASPRPNGAAGGSEVSVTNRVRRVTSGEDIDADTLIKIAASRGRTSTPHVQQSHTSTKSPARSPTRARPNSATRGNGVTRGRFPKNTPRERSPLRPNGASGEYETSLTNRVRRVQSGEDIDEDTLIKIAASRGRGPFPEQQSLTSAQSPERSPYQARPRSRSPASRGTVSPRSPKKRVLRVLSGDDMDDIDADTMIKIAEASGRGPVAPVQQSPSSPKRSPVRARGVSPDERSISPTPPVRVPPPSQNRGRSFGGPDLDEDIMIKIAAASGSQATTRQTADVAERATSPPLTEATSADEATSDNGGGEGDFGLEVIDASCSFHCEEKTHDQNGLILDAPPVKTGGKGSKVSLKKAAKGLLKQFRKKKQ
eukprot:Sro394_g133770.2  (466) ;mRNA; f:11749-13146